MYLDWHQLFEERLARDIGPIAGFGYGTPSEAIAAADKVYPLLWLESTPFATQPAATPGGTAPNVLEWRSAFYILDIALEGTQSFDQAGRVQVINRCWAIAEACLAYLYKFSESLNGELGSISITPIVDEFADRSTGVRVEVTLMLQSDWDGCALPLAGFTPGPNPGGGGGASFCDLVLVCTAPLQAQITANTAAIIALQLAVQLLQTQVGDLTAAVDLLGMDVAALNEAVVALGLDVDGLQLEVSALGGDVDSLEGRMDAVEDRLDVVEPIVALNATQKINRIWLYPDLTQPYYANGRQEPSSVALGAGVIWFVQMFERDFESTGVRLYNLSYTSGTYQFAVFEPDGTALTGWTLMANSPALAVAGGAVVLSWASRTMYAGRAYIVGVRCTSAGMGTGLALTRAMELQLTLPSNAARVRNLLFSETWTTATPPPTLGAPTGAVTSNNTPIAHFLEL